MIDQTGQDITPETDFTGKNVLIIGSGNDNDGRRLGKDIDNGRFDVVVRVNKPYGDPRDVGTKTDVVFIRWAKWLDIFWKDQDTRTKVIVIVNQNVGMSKTEYQMGLMEVGHDNISCGLSACLWAINRNAKRVFIMGFGEQQGQRMTQKRYCQNSHNYKAGMVDDNPHYDWDKERQWLKAQPQIEFLR